MAGTSTGMSSPSLLLLLSSSSPTKFQLSYISPAIPHRTLLHLPSQNHRIERSTNPRISIQPPKDVCWQLNSGPSRGGVAPEGIEEAFDEDREIEEESEDEEEEEEDDDETESSMDLLFRFLQSMFNKLSKRAKKATRSMLPPAISPQLVSFAVDGVLLLTLLSIVKALLQVVCTLGGTVFVVILLLRVIWATASHFQSSGNSFDQKGSSYTTTQPSM